MPYTSPLHLPLAAQPSRIDSIDSEAAVTLPERPHLPRSYSAQSYIRRHRRSPSFSKLAPLSVQEAPAHLTHTERITKLTVVDPHASLRQSPPPRTNAIIPSGAVISPPESAGNSSDEETSPTTLHRSVPAERLDAAIRSLQNERERTNQNGGRDGEEQEVKIVDRKILLRRGAPPLSREARAISHSRSATENDIPILTDSVESSPNDSDHDETLPKPPMLRKKSGEVVRPALRTKRRPSSMPGTPTFSKNVHFDSQLEHIRHFLQLDKPLAVSANTSPVETYSDEPEYPFRKVEPFEWEIKLPNFPSDTSSRRTLPVRLDRLYLSSDQKNLVGVVVVANLSFHKQVLARFTLDYWKTVSEVTAEYNHDVRRKHAHDGFDRFNFSIKLSDITNLETKTLFLCIRYTVGGQEYWDNNSSMNYQVDFAKKERNHSAESHSMPTTNAHDHLPRSRKATPPAMRPRSMPPSFDEFGTSPPSFSMSRGSRNADSEFRLTPADSHDFLLEQPKPREKPVRQAFGNRYDFGVSLSAARTKGTSEDRTTLTAKAKSSNGQSSTGLSQSQPVPLKAAGTPPTLQPSAIVSGKPHHESSSYKELVDKYCFYGSAKSLEPRLGSTPPPYDGGASPLPSSLDESLPRVDSGISMSSSDKPASSSASSSGMNSYTSTPIMYNPLYRSHFGHTANGFLQESHPPAILG